MDLVCGGCGAEGRTAGDRCDRCEPCWYAVLDGMLIGPITRDELGSALRANPGSADAPVWREGIDAWAPAREIPDVVDAIRAASASARPRVRAATIPPPAPIPDLARHDELTGSGRVDLAALLATSRALAPARVPAPRTNESTIPPAEVPAHVARPRGGSFARGALIGACLAAVIAIAPTFASIAGEPEPAPVLVASAPLEPGPMFVQPAAAAPTAIVVPAVAEIAAPSAVELDEAEGAPEIVAAPPPVRVATSPAPAMRGDEAPAPEIVAEAPAAPEVVEVTTPSEIVAPPETSEAPVATIDALIEAAVGAPSDVEAADAPAAPAPDALPVTPDREDVDHALTRAHTAVAACGEHGHGLAMVRITARGDTGRVTSAVVEGPLAGTAAGSCVARAVRSVTFTRFARESFTIEYPFRI
ncbi:GYF domain-containing protein [Sandaracinus amylolyticus]|uniref:Fe-S oxidoreductase n=1 Tax=Sandaracinus amylolyticus TaxID=927083 RepID=A0A0F6W0S8_9BACT|nr:GYF domain-containing protein [Sandaracinus amylolyticus]AKF04327.1 Fe-S oxidoreductase [Sandaracinus amylolyticus]